MTTDPGYAEVRLHGRTIGRIEALPAQMFRFVLDVDYVEERRHAVLGQVFEDDPAGPWRSSVHLCPFFTNLLPDPEGRLADLLCRQHGIKATSEFRMLCLLGDDLPGAVEVGLVGHVEATDAGDATVWQVPSDEDEEGLRFSLGGVQLKFSALQKDGRLTIPVRGVGGDWLVKLPDPRFPGVTENEHATMRWAQAAGFDVPEVGIAQLAEIDRMPAEVEPVGAALKVRRFDRTPDGGRVHIEDFAQVLNVFPAQKYKATNYETLAAKIHALSGEEAYLECVRRLVLVFASGNADAHIKNWSLIYGDQRTPALAPLYDQVHTLAFPGTSRTLALKFAKSRRFSDVGLDGFRRLARKLGLDEEETARTAVETSERLAETLDTVCQLPGGEAYAASIREHWAQCPLFRRFTG